jgi:hypothetical protein
MVKRGGLFSVINEDRELHVIQDTRQPRFHESDVRVSLAFLLLIALSIIVGVKVHYASVLSASNIGFHDMCSIDQFFDPIISFTAGSLTAIIGFYFGERAR